MTTTLIAAYMGQGLIATRPATPAVSTGSSAFYFATDTGVLSCYAGGAWSDVGGGTKYVPAGSGYSSSSVSLASLGTPFKPSITMKFSEAFATLTTVAGATYRVGFAPWDTVNRKILSAPTYSNTVVAGASAAGQTLKFTFAAQQTATAGTDYILFYTRTDSTSTVSITFIFCTGGIVGPGFFRDAVAGSNMTLASLAPLTSDVWTSGTSPVLVFPTYTL